MSVIAMILQEMQSDDSDDSERLERIYQDADKEGKKLIDSVLICICGYSYPTLKEMTEE